MFRLRFAGLEGLNLGSRLPGLYPRRIMTRPTTKFSIQQSYDANKQPTDKCIMYIFTVKSYQKQNTDKYIKFRYLVQPYSLATVATEAIARTNS